MIMKKIVLLLCLLTTHLSAMEQPVEIYGVLHNDVVLCQLALELNATLTTPLDIKRPVMDADEMCTIITQFLDNGGDPNFCSNGEHTGCKKMSLLEIVTQRFFDVNLTEKLLNQGALLNPELKAWAEKSKIFRDCRDDIKNLLRKRLALLT